MSTTISMVARKRTNQAGKVFKGVSTNSAQESDLNLPLLTNAASVSYSPKSFQYVRIKSCSIGHVLHGKKAVILPQKQ